MAWLPCPAWLELSSKADGSKDAFFNFFLLKAPKYKQSTKNSTTATTAIDIPAITPAEIPA